MEPAKMLIDSGLSRNFIDTSYVRKEGIPTTKLKNQWSVVAIDRKEVMERISEKVAINIEVEGKTLRCNCYVMSLRDTDIIFGKDWLDVL